MNSIITGLEDSQCRHEVSTTLCTAPSNTLNIVAQLDLGDCLTFMLPTSQLRTSFNNSHPFLRLQHPKRHCSCSFSDADTLISEARNQRQPADHSVLECFDDETSALSGPETSGLDGSLA